MKKISLGLVALALAVGMTACGGGDGESADAGDFCAKAKSFTELSDTLSDTTDSLVETGGDPADIEETWTEFTDSLDEFEKAAPDEVRDDIATVNGVADGISTILEESDYDFANIIAKAATDPSTLEELERRNAADVEAAADRVEKYVSTECGIELDGES